MQFNQEDIDIGERLRGIRENMHMTREQFSEKIDITDSFLGQIERGERALSVKTLKQLLFDCWYLNSFRSKYFQT